jgi:hypothetical protein
MVASRLQLYSNLEILTRYLQSNSQSMAGMLILMVVAVVITMTQVMLVATMIG